MIITIIIIIVIYSALQKYNIHVCLYNKSKKSEKSAQNNVQALNIHKQNDV